MTHGLNIIIYLKSMRVSVQPKSNDRKFQAKFETVDSKFGDDLECEFCEALITNLREIITVNTTRDEFLLVLKGLCTKTGSYDEEVCYLILKNSFKSQIKLLFLNIAV